MKTKRSRRHISGNKTGKTRTRSPGDNLELAGILIQVDQWNTSKITRSKKTGNLDSGTGDEA